MPVVSLPEQGQLVEVQQRGYVVTDVRQSTLPPDPLKLHNPTPQYRVALSSSTDDRLGEELQVIWEVGPGAQVVKGSTLPRPDDFDDPDRFDAFFDAFPWGAIASADVRSPTNMDLPHLRMHPHGCGDAECKMRWLPPEFSRELTDVSVGEIFQALGIEQPDEAIGSQVSS